MVIFHSYVSLPEGSLPKSAKVPETVVLMELLSSLLSMKSQLHLE